MRAADLARQSAERERKSLNQLQEPLVRLVAKKPKKDV